MRSGISWSSPTMMLILCGTFTVFIHEAHLTAQSRLFHNGERARTCNSVVTKSPGLYASINNSTDPETDTIIGYISPAGIPSIASQKDQYLDVITPYGAFPTVLFDKAVGLAWWRNMATGKKMQSKSRWSWLFRLWY